MPNTFLTFQKINNETLANALAELLIANNIPVQIENERTYFDVSFANNKFDANINVKIEPQNFDKAYQVLETYYATDLQNVAPNYYLLEFTTNELLNIVKKPYDWSVYDYLLAKKLLQKKDVNISDEDIAKYKTDYITEKEKPTQSPIIWIVIGYAACILQNAIFFWGYFIGLAITIGITLALLKKTLPNGQSIFYFDKTYRNHGFIILTISIISTLYWIIIAFKVNS